MDRILVSGGGIAGLTFAIELKRHGFDPLVIEREPALRREGYMMDFFGSGWDVAQRMGLLERLHDFRYPIDALEFVGAAGKPFLHVPIARFRHALGDKYIYLRRQDLERALAERARAAGVPVRYGTSVAALHDRGDGVHVRFDDGSEDRFALAIGADGVHSRLRELVFGPERQFARYLGLQVAAFHLPRADFPVTRSVTIYEEPDRLAMVYPLDGERLDATFVLRAAEPYIAHEHRDAFLHARMRGAGWMIGKALARHPAGAPMFFDSVTQIVMPEWHRGRVALIGDACGCLTLIAGQGSHMAMAGAYVLARELARQPNYAKAFVAYQRFLKPHIERKQRDARLFARVFVPTKRSHPWLRRLTIRLVFSAALLGLGQSLFGWRSILPQKPRESR